MDRLNDLLLNMIVNPLLSLEELLMHGLSSSNTTVNMDKNEYKKNKIIQDAFTGPDGVFDENAFNLKYSEAILLYNVMSDNSRNEYVLKIINSMPFAENSRLGDPYAVKKAKYNLKITPTPYIEQDVFSGKTSTYSSQGVFEPGILGDRLKTELEVAESLKILTNPVAVSKGEKPIWTDAPEGLFSKGHWKDYFTTKVLARYEDNGTHIDMMTGEEKPHFQGELKLNEEGKPYYEYLDGRSVYGKEVLNKFNTITKEDSWINKYDFFDSDDILLKSPVGMTMQGLALVGTMFLPYVGPYIALSSMLLLVSSVAAKIAKMATGDPDSPFLNAVEGFLKSLDRQTLKTEYAREHTWSPENVLNSITDLTALLRELRAIFDAMPVLLGGSKYVINGKFSLKALEKGIRANVAEETKTLQEGLKNIPITKDGLVKTVVTEPVGSLSKTQIALLQSMSPGVGLYKAIQEINETLRSYYGISGMLSKAYIASLISSNLYEEAIMSGLSPEDAAIVTLGRFASEMLLLNTPVGNAILPELRVERLLARRLLNNVFKAEGSERAAVFSKIKDASGKYLLGTDKSIKLQKFQDLLSKGWNLGERSSKIVDKMSGASLKDVALSAIASGIEIGTVNDIEEFLNDTWKQAYNFVSSDNAKKFSNEMAPWQNMFDRYGMGMVSGLVGGSITSGFSNYSVLNNVTNVTPESAWQLIIHELRQDGPNSEFFKRLFLPNYTSPDLSSKRYSIDEKGNTVWAPVLKGELSLDQEVKLLMSKLLTNVHEILESHKLEIPDKELLHYITHGNYTYEDALKDMAYNQLANTKAVSAVLLEYNNICADIVKAEIAIKEAYEKVGDLKADREKIEQEVVKYKEQLDDALKRKDELLDDKNIILNYITPALYEANPILHSEENPFDVYYYAKVKGYDYEKLNDEQKILLLLGFDKAMKYGGTDLMRMRSQKLLDNINLLQEELKQHAESVSSPEIITNTLKESIDKIFDGASLESKDALLDLFISKDHRTLATMEIGDQLGDSDLALFHALNEDASFALKFMYYLFLARADEGTKKDFAENIKQYQNYDAIISLLQKIYSNKEITENDRELLRGIEINGLQLDEALTIDNISDYIKTLEEAKQVLNKNNNQLEESLLIELGFEMDDSAGYYTYNNENNKLSTLFKSIQYLPLPLKDSLTSLFRKNIGDVLNEYAENSLISDEDVINALDDVLNLIDLKPNSLIEESIDRFLSKTLKEKSFSISKLITTLNNALDSVEEVSLFSVDNLMLELIDYAISALTYYDNLVNAIRRDNKSPMNLFGFTSSLNELAHNRHIGDWQDLLEVDAEQADVLMQDTYQLINRLNYYKYLFSLISGKKLATLNRIAANYVNKMYSKLNTVFANLSGDSLFKDKKDLLKGILDDLGNISALSGKKSIGPNGLTAIFEDLYKLNNVIKDVFLDMTPELIAQFMNFKANFKDILHPSENVFNDETDNIEDFHLYYYIAAASSLDFSAFMNAVSLYIKTLQLSQDKDNNVKLITPMFMLLMSDYGMLSFILNHGQYNKFTLALRLYAKEVLKTDESNKNTDLDSVIIRLRICPYLDNVISLMGAAGAGKSAALISYVYNILSLSNINDLTSNVVLLHAANSKQAENMVKSLKAVGATNKNIQTYESVPDFINKVICKELNKDNYRLTQKEYDEGFDMKKDIKFIDESAVRKPSLIIIDEILALGKDVLLLLDKYCKLNNIYILGYGDTVQMSDKYSLKSQDGKKIAMLTFDFISSALASPKIGATIRTAVNVKSLNQSLLESFMGIEDGIYPEYITLKYGKKDDTIIEKDSSGKLVKRTIEKALFGDKIYRMPNTGDFAPGTKIYSEFIEYLNEFKSRLKSGEKIGYIYHSTNTPLYKLLEANKDFVEFYDQRQALGSESSFYIIEPFIPINEGENANEEQRNIARSLSNTIYTGITRGLKATITFLVGSLEGFPVIRKSENEEYIGIVKLGSSTTNNIVFEELKDAELLNNTQNMLNALLKFTDNKNQSIAYVHDNSINELDTIQVALNILNTFGTIYFDGKPVNVELKEENGVIYVYKTEGEDAKIQDWESFKNSDSRTEGYYTLKEIDTKEDEVKHTLADYTEEGGKRIQINGEYTYVNEINVNTPEDVTIILKGIEGSYSYNDIKQIIDNLEDILEKLNKNEIEGESFKLKDKTIIILKKNGDNKYDVLTDGEIEYNYTFDNISELKYDKRYEIPDMTKSYNGYKFYSKGDKIIVGAQIDGNTYYFEYNEKGRSNIQKEVKNIVKELNKNLNVDLRILLKYYKEELPDNIDIKDNKEINKLYNDKQKNSIEDVQELIELKDVKNEDSNNVEESILITQDSPSYNLYTFNIFSDHGLTEEAFGGELKESLFTEEMGQRIDGVFGVYRLLHHSGLPFKSDAIKKLYNDISYFIQNYTCSNKEMALDEFSNSIKTILRNNGITNIPKELFISLAVEKISEKNNVDNDSKFDTFTRLINQNRNKISLLFRYKLPNEQIATIADFTFGVFNNPETLFQQYINFLKRTNKYENSVFEKINNDKNGRSLAEEGIALSILQKYKENTEVPNWFKHILELYAYHNNMCKILEDSEANDLLSSRTTGPIFSYEIGKYDEVNFGFSKGDNIYSVEKDIKKLGLHVSNPMAVVNGKVGTALPGNVFVIVSLNQYSNDTDYINQYIKESVKDYSGPRTTKLVSILGLDIKAEDFFIYLDNIFSGKKAENPINRFTPFYILLLLAQHDREKPIEKFLNLHDEEIKFINFIFEKFDESNDKFVFLSEKFKYDFNGLGKEEELSVIEWANRILAKARDKKKDESIYKYIDQNLPLRQRLKLDTNTQNNVQNDANAQIARITNKNYVILGIVRPQMRFIDPSILNFVELKLDKFPDRFKDDTGFYTTKLSMDSRFDQLISLENELSKEEIESQRIDEFFDELKSRYGIEVDKDTFTLKYKEIITPDINTLDFTLKLLLGIDDKPNIIYYKSKNSIDISNVSQEILENNFNGLDTVFKNNGDNIISAFLNGEKIGTIISIEVTENGINYEFKEDINNGDGVLKSEINFDLSQIKNITDLEKYIRKLFNLDELFRLDVESDAEFSVMIEKLAETIKEYGGTEYLNIDLIDNNPLLEQDLLYLRKFIEEYENKAKGCSIKRIRL